jgi:probable F420-dependent oxidoreductase
LLDWALFAEDAGFHTVVVSDHVAPTREVTRVYPPPFYDPFTTLAWLAGRTTSVQLGTSVLVLPYRHPLLTARVAAMLHEISGGRFVLGVGVGWSRSEFAALGLDFRDRGPTTDRHLEVITAAWSQDEVSADHPGLTFADVATGPRPRRGSVPLWVGGSGSSAMRRAVRFGAAWHPLNPDRSWLAHEGIPALRSESRRQGVAVPDVVPRIRLRLTADRAGASRPLGVGALDQVVADIRSLAEMGCELVVLDPNPDTPRPRDHERERADLAAVRSALGD